MSDPYSDAVLDLIADGLANMRAVVPGTVDKVARAADRERDVDFAPGIGRKVAAEDTADGTVPSAPVLYPAGGGFSQVWPLVAGDEGLALVCDRNPELWRANRAVGEAHHEQLPHDVSNAVVLPVSITAPTGAPADPGDDWVMTGPEGECMRVGGTDGAVTLTKSGVSVATITLSAAGEITLTPESGQSVNVGGVATLALNDPLITAIDAMLTALVAAGASPAFTGAATAQTAWNGAKSAIASQIAKGA